MLTFEKLTEVNVARCKRWHHNGLEDWSPEKWFLATIGELGETANALKKLWRVEAEMANISEPDRQISTRKQAVEIIGAEVADTVIYLNLYATRIGRKLMYNEKIPLYSGMSTEYYLKLAVMDISKLMLEDALHDLQRFCISLGINMMDEVIKKFNATSIKYGFPERL